MPTDLVPTASQQIATVDTEEAAIALISERSARVAPLLDAGDVRGLLDERDASAGILHWTKAQHKGVELQNAGAKWNLQCTRALGILTREMEKQKPGEYQRLHRVTVAPSYADLGLEKVAVHRWQLVASVPDRILNNYVDSAEEQREEITIAAVLKIAKGLALAEVRDSYEKLKQCGGGIAAVRQMTALDFLATLPEGSVDLLLTDPPYSTDVDDIHEFACEWLPVALSKVKRAGRAYVFIGAYPDELLAYLMAPRAGFELAQVLVWTYRNTLGPAPLHDYKLNWQAVLYYRGCDAPPLDCPQMNEQFSVQDVSAPDGRRADRWHEWQKPDEIAERFIRHGAPTDGLVLDPFAGTGTFLAAAARLGRNGLGAEVDGAMLRLCEKRGIQVDEP